MNKLGLQSVETTEKVHGAVPHRQDEDALDEHVERSS